MPDSLLLLIGVIILAIGFGVANGFNDAANAIATVIGTRTLSPRVALMMAACFSFIGATTGTAVAVTIGKGIISPEVITTSMVLAGTIPIIIWAFVASYHGMPISTTHGLVGGLVGAGIAMEGQRVIVWSILVRVLAAIIISPLLGFIGGLLGMVIVTWVFKNITPQNGRLLFSKLQIVSAAFLAYSHGKNNGQIPLGLICMGLMAYCTEAEFIVPWWAILASAASISFGMAVGGGRVIGTVGLKMTALQPVHGFVAETAAATVVECASALGIPVSTTHCSSSAVMGVGSCRRLSAVRWGIAQNIMLAWVFTLPVCVAIGWLIATILKLIS
jgi:inorganic phosphate transporter, PiT family